MVTSMSIARWLASNRVHKASYVQSNSVKGYFVLWHVSPPGSVCDRCPNSCLNSVCTHTSEGLHVSYQIIPPHRCSHG